MFLIMRSDNRSGRKGAHGPSAWIALRGILYGSTFVLLWTWLVFRVRRFDAQLPVGVPLFLRPLGIGVGIAGGLLMLWCVAAFILVGRGTPAPFDPPREFVATGPYRYVRNPMYIGGLTAILGAGLVLGSLSIVLLAGFFGLCAHLFVVFYEEPALRRRFGERYDRYTSVTRRWLPSIPKAETEIPR